MSLEQLHKNFKTNLAIGLFLVLAQVTTTSTHVDKDSFSSDIPRSKSSVTFGSIGEDDIAIKNKAFKIEEGGEAIFDPQGIKRLGRSANNKEDKESWDYWKTRLGVPYFLNSSQSHVVTSRGQTSYLHCLVGNVGDRQVSWIRIRDLKILSIGQVRYTSDSRFAPLHEDGNDAWVLKIHDSRLEDSGRYECQISYHDDIEKKLKMPVRLTVLDSRAFITGRSRERHVNEGSRLFLACHIRRSSGPPSYVYWYRDDKVINYAGRDGLRVSLDKSIGGSADEAGFERPVSTLDIFNVTGEDAGKYTCAPSNARNYSVVIHIVKGENLAMQRRKNQQKLLKEKQKNLQHSNSEKQKIILENSPSKKNSNSLSSKSAASISTATSEASRMTGFTFLVTLLSVLLCGKCNLVTLFGK